MTVHSPTVRDIITRGTVGNAVVHMHPVSDNGNGILHAGVGLRILCQHNFEHNQLLSRGIMLAKYGIFPKKKVWSSCVSREHSSSTMCMPMASSSSTCIMLSEGPGSTDIDSEQAQQKSVGLGRLG